MMKWIVLLRGINVGGHNKLPMAELRSLLEGMGCHDIKTYIQSGNCIFTAPETSAGAIEQKIQSAIDKVYDFKPRILAVTREDLRATLAANPYPVDDDKGATVHFFFLAQEAIQADMDALDSLRASDEAWTLTPKVFYLHAPSGIGRSKLAARAEAKLGVAATARNIKTVKKLAQLAG
ncbi:DUF1697 domain-containing protein [Robiginitomaculum antarcticum]|uniref:DUF1697 domain-containing protein n=1 Tax=Robiginitomaculum antarcticum TaxID=437507 RepID=UPI00039C7630